MNTNDNSESGAARNGDASVPAGDPLLAAENGFISKVANEMFATGFAHGPELTRAPGLSGVAPSVPLPPSGLGEIGWPYWPLNATESNTLIDAAINETTKALGAVGLKPEDPLHSPFGQAIEQLAVSMGSPSVTEASCPGYYFLRDHGVFSAAGDLEPKTGRAPLLPGVSFNPETLRKQFPALNQRVHGRNLIWLDNAATTQKPWQVIEAVSQYYQKDNSNIHRGAHALAARATDQYEQARTTVQRFIGAADVREIVFVRGTTEAINLVAQSYGRKHFGPGDEILLTTLEHHANIVPWQLVCEQTGAVIRVAPINDAGEVIMEEFAALIGRRTKLVAVSQVSNALGTVVPVQEIIRIARAAGVPVLVDGAQSIPHLPVNVAAMDCDFFVFSGHKIYGPTGIGVLYGKARLLEEMPPWQGGGSMIKNVTFAGSEYQGIPQKFEAGTPIIAGAIGLATALDFVTRLGIPAISAYENMLLAYATEHLAAVPGLRPIGTAKAKASVASFVMDGLSSEDVGRHLDSRGIAVRAGHHCAQPALRRFGLSSTVRPSLAMYNTKEEIDALVAALRELGRR